jgi:hypothetical protein
MVCSHCACICIEFSLEKGFLEAVQITLDNRKHIQLVDYEKLPFKCKKCHEYGHFTKNYPKNIVIEQVSQEKDEKWKQVEKKRPNNKQVVIASQPKKVHPSIVALQPSRLS